MSRLATPVALASLSARPVAASASADETRRIDHPPAGLAGRHVVLVGPRETETR